MHAKLIETLTANANSNAGAGLNSSSSSSSSSNLLTSAPTPTQTSLFSTSRPAFNLKDITFDNKSDLHITNLLNKQPNAKRFKITNSLSNEPTESQQISSKNLTSQKNSNDSNNNINNKNNSQIILNKIISSPSKEITTTMTGTETNNLAEHGNTNTEIQIRPKRLTSLKSLPVSSKTSQNSTSFHIPNTAQNEKISTTATTTTNTVKVSSISTRVNNSNTNETNINNDKTLIESLNIIETQTINKRPIRTSPNKTKSNTITTKSTNINDIPKTTTNSTNSSTTNQTNKSNSTTSTSRNSFACLRNLGSTCYINCIIQVMRYTPGFILSINRLNKQIDYLKSLKNPDIDTEINRNNDIIFVKNLHELLVEMSKIEKSDRRPIYTPRKFVNTVWTSLSFWSDGSQQDAHEFLQYTIHFINECDLSIRKIQQQYQIKQIPTNENITLVNSNTSVINSNTDSIQNNSKIKSQKQNKKTSKQIEQTSQEIELLNKKNNINFLKCKSTTNINEIFVNNSHLITDESSSSSTSSTCSSSASSTSAISSSTYQSCLLKTDQIRLIKSIPKLNQTNSLSSETNNFMRTPTKGGASSFNISLLDSLTNTKNSITQSASNSNLSKTNKKDTGEELIFRPMIKSETGELTKREPIKVKFQLDKTNENYRIVNSTVKSPTLIIDDKDLVSKRLKETLNSCEDDTIKPINRIKQKNEDLSLNNKNKRFKQENFFSKFADCDTSNIIIIDSDDNDDDVYFMDDDEIERNDFKQSLFSSNLITNTTTSTDSTNIDTKIINQNSLTPQIKQDDEPINQQQEEHISEIVFERENIEVKSISDIEKSESPNFEIKNCYVLLEKIDAEQLKCLTKSPSRLALSSPQQQKLNTEKQNEILNLKTNIFDESTNETRNTEKLQPQQNVKKLKSKSKTFPQTTPTIPLLQNDTNQAQDSSSNIYADLDAISTISTVKSTNNQSNSNLSETATNLRSKLRSNSSSQSLRNLSPVRSPIPLPSITCTSNSAPPSPAELLRKYSSSIGYICEMDKLFKGSSITVTQCLECENLRKCPESFYDRSIPIETTDTTDDLDESSCWISKCLSNESYLNDNSKYMCDQCASKQEAKIHTQYTQMPNILILHLLSYGITSSDDGNLNTRKLSNRLQLVNYFDFVCKKEEQLSSKNQLTSVSNDVFKSPITTRRQLQIKREILKDPTSNTTNNNNETFKHQFKLFAVVMHSGVSLNSGHYTAFVNYKIISENFSCYENSPFKLSNGLNGRSSSVGEYNLNENNNIKNSKINSSGNGSYNDLAQIEWLHFDDTKVKSLSNNEFQRKIVDSNYDSPYILFYVRD